MRKIVFMWYDSIQKYHNIYMAINDGIRYYFDKYGNYLTQSYKPLSPENSTFVKWYDKPSIIIESTHSFTISEQYTCQVEFTSQGLIYGFGTYRRHTDIHTGLILCCDTDFEYIFVPYEDE